MRKRKSISPGTRFDIFKRDGFRCVYCGRSPPQVELQCDHVVPVSKGGGDESDNLVTSCVECNAGKAAKDAGGPVESIADSLRSDVERKRQLQEYNKFLMADRKKREKQARKLAIYFCDKIFPGENRILKDLTGLRTFLQKLPEAEIMEAIDIAAVKFSDKRLFDRAVRYMAGICWRKIRAMEDGDRGPD